MKGAAPVSWPLSTVTIAVGLLKLGGGVVVVFSSVAVGSLVEGVFAASVADVESGTDGCGASRSELPVGWAFQLSPSRIWL